MGTRSNITGREMQVGIALALFMLMPSIAVASQFHSVPISDKPSSVCNERSAARSVNKSATRSSERSGVGNAFKRRSTYHWSWPNIDGSLHYPIVTCGKGRGRASHCSVQNAYGEWPNRQKCHAAQAVFPMNEAELVEAVAGAVRRQQSMKVATATGHSMPQWACPRGSRGLIISTQNLNRRIDVNQSAMRVSVDSGVQLRELVDTLARAELALAHSPYWDAMTVGGLISTGSHGSSLVGKGGAVHEYVVGMRLVVPAPSELGYARVMEVSTEDPFFLNAARVSLGVLGAISQVTLQVEPQFKRAITKGVEWDDKLEEKMEEIGQANDFGHLTWLPSMYKVAVSKERRVPCHVSNNGMYVFFPFQPIHLLVRATLKILELIAERSAACKCAMAALLSSAVLRHGPRLKWVQNERSPIVQLNHQLQAHGSCSRSKDPNWACPWARPSLIGYFYHEIAFTLSLENMTLLLQDIKKLREIAKPTSLCGLDFYSGILLRYIKQSNAYLGHQTDGIAMDITFYRSYQAHIPRLDEDVYEEIEQMALFKYGGWPHWGKNRPLAFIDLQLKYPNMDKFLLVKDIVDPEGLFSNEWSDSTLGINGNVSSQHDYCALEGLCVCSEDRHCAPKSGYFCEPGRVYKEARVCRARTRPSLRVFTFLHTFLISWMQTSITFVVTLAYDLTVYVQKIFS